MRFLVLAFLMTMFGSSWAFDLRDYFPSEAKTIVLSNMAGANHARYTFTPSHPGFAGIYGNLMNLGKPGQHYTWQKEYWKNNAWCTSTYAVMFMGDDASVTEVGDWLASTPCTPNVAFGYRTAQGANTGLMWAPPGGLTTTPAVAEMNVWRQLAPGAAYNYVGAQAYSKTGVVGYYPEFETELGAVFSDVLHIVMYHGTRMQNGRVVRCDVPPIAANGVYYQSFKNYNSYAMELWLARGIGVIQERTPFIEDGTYWGIADCTGEFFTYPEGSTVTSAAPGAV